MFVWSFKAGKKQLVMCGCVLLLVVVLFTVLFGGGGVVETAAKLRYPAENAEQRQSFLEQFGWKTETDPAEICEIIIPESFNDTFMRYNAMQTAQGFDLSALQGKRVKRWTYVVTNYPGYEGTVYANLLVMDGNVVGGDISAAEQNGFVHGFSEHGTGLSSLPAESVKEQ